jgi:hypothetical protein
VIWVYGVGEDGVKAFTDSGIKNLIELIKFYKENLRCSGGDCPACDLRRMDTPIAGWRTLDDEQIDFLFEQIETGVAAIDAELETAAKDKPKRRRGCARTLRLTWSGLSRLLNRRSRLAARIWRGPDWRGRIGARLDVTAANFRVIVTRRPRRARKPEQRSAASAGD